MDADTGGLGAERSTVRRSGRWSYWPPLAVIVIGLAVTAVLAVVSHSVYVHNERRLLRLRTKGAESVLTASLPGLQTPLASAEALANATHGNARKFREFIAPYVGRMLGQSFTSVSLWRLDDLAAGPKAVVGIAPELGQGGVQSFLAPAARMPGLSVLNLLGLTPPRVGWAYGRAQGGPYVVYGESSLPANREQPPQSNPAFSDLNVAVYLGRTQNARDLLVTTTPHQPFAGPRTVSAVPFGNGEFTLIVSPRRSLAGSLPQRLPLIIALAGLVLTLLAAALTSRLVQRHNRAEHLARELERAAAENRRLYSEQRDIAQTLQHALLPDALPALPGLEAAGRYVAGEAGIDIGGDWYDVIPVSDSAVLIAVGDVSGRGLKAAATMASLRFAIHAYAVQQDPPDEILCKLQRLLSVTESGQMATVMCAVTDLKKRELTVASAGHLPPLLVADGAAEYVTNTVGVPIGVEEECDYPTTTVKVARGSTLLAYTDGLVERRHESLDQGLARLRRVAVGNHVPLPELLSHVLGVLHDQAPHDDTAIVGVRWTA